MKCPPTGSVKGTCRRLFVTKKYISTKEAGMFIRIKTEITMIKTEKEVFDFSTE